MGKNGCGQFIRLATIYSSDSFNTSYGHVGFKDGSKRYSGYTAKSSTKVNSSSNFTEYEEGCECTANYNANANSSYKSFASSDLNPQVDNYGSIIVRNKIKSLASTNSSDNIINNLFLVYCGPATSSSTFTQNGSIQCTNNEGTKPLECESQCNTTQTNTSTKIEKQGKQLVPVTTSSSSNDPCLSEPPFTPDTRFFTKVTDTDTDQEYKYEREINNSWQSDKDCSKGSYNFKDKRSVELKLTGEIDLAACQNTRYQAISKRLDIYNINGPQNQKGDKCKNPNISPDEYDCWDFAGIEYEYLYVDEIYYSWKVRIKPYVTKEDNLPPDITEFKGTVHAYAIPAEFDEYGDAHLPYTGISDCNCGSKAVDDIMPFASISVSVPKDGESIQNGSVIIGPSIELQSNMADTQESFVVYCVEDKTFD